MSWQWFLKIDEFIDGPLSTADLQTRIQAGQIQSSYLVWGRGMESWLTVKDWSAQLPNLLGKTMQEAIPEAWHFAVDGQSYGPFTRRALLQKLKPPQNLSNVVLWTVGMKEWSPLFEFHDILSELGVNKRQFPRANITGKVVLKGTGTTLVAPLVSISEGGFGVQLDGGVTSGQILTVELHSPAFRDLLHAKAEVRYNGIGVIGFKFTQLSVEAKGAIIQFVRQGQIMFPINSAA